VYIEEIDKLEEKANYIRNQILDMCVRAGTGHVTSSFSCTEIFVALRFLSLSIMEGYFATMCPIQSGKVVIDLF